MSQSTAFQAPLPFPAGVDGWSSLRHWLWWIAVAGFLVVLGLELFVPAQRQSQTPDEANHMLAGVRYWKYSDFGTNPEHPPLAKMVAALPVLRVPCPPSAPYTQFFKGENFRSGSLFLYQHDADAMLLRTRMAASIFTFALALLVLAAGCEMFGRITGLLALGLLVFEPNLLAHGSLVTTDMAATCCYFGAVYAYYRWSKHCWIQHRWIQQRWSKQRTALRIIICGLTVGLALAAKHSAIVLVPVLFLLALTELLAVPAPDQANANPHTRQVLRLICGLAVIAVMGYAMLWAFYGFRYHARPGGIAMVPTLAAYTNDLPEGWPQALIRHLSARHLLPEAYLFGLVDIVMASRRDPMFLLGMNYATGHWFYFPVTVLIKSTLGLLLLVSAAPFLGRLRYGRKREMTFLLLPSMLYFAVSLTSTMDIGVRHILPVYPFLVLVGAASAGALSHRGRWGMVVTAVLVLCHAASTTLAFPYYLTYANEAWGGPANTYHLLTDSNVDWGEGLKAAKEYLDGHGVKDCWFAHYGWNVDPAYYQIPCRPLPEGLSHWFGAPLPPTPSTIEGTILVSGSEANGDYWGPGDLNPYVQFLKRRPDAIIANSILVFKGKFDVSRLSGLTHISRAQQLMGQHHFNEALTEMRTALDLAPNSAEAQAVLGDILMQMDRKNEAHRAYQDAIATARSDYPDFQMARILHLPPAYSPK